MKTIQSSLRLFSFIILCAIFTAACSSPAVTRRVIRFIITATPAATATPPPLPARTGTPAPTPTPFPTATPTPTAIPISFSGDPSSEGLQPPTPEAGAYCGYVDTFDFPLEPPDAAGARGGQDFGVFRARYDKYHAGEDWGLFGGSLGEPVYAIGHGVVTYADGLGWGIDKGVIIIRHTFPDNSTILSFYGHLDPPSVRLQPGTCVTRGQRIANIGDPSSSPHLHFEIRHHMPHVPGPGYWPEDPTQAGWEPPSAFIWDYRAARAPQVLWSRYDLSNMAPVGLLNDETYILQEGSRLVGLYIPAGGLRWTHELTLNPADTLLAPEKDQVFTIKGVGSLEAFRIPDPDEARSQGEFLVPAWEARLEDVFLPELAPLPGGGVVVFASDRQIGFSRDGELLWDLQIPGRPAGWLLESGGLLVSLGDEDGEIWELGLGGGEQVAAGASGRLAADQDWVYALGSETLSRIDRQSGRAQTLAIFPEAYQEGVLVLPAGGGLLVFHGDVYDRRLLSYDNDGVLLWERSIKRLGGRDVRLLDTGGAVYLLAQEVNQSVAQVRLFAVDPRKPALELVFEGGTRNPAVRRTWIESMAGGLLLQIGGGSLLFLER